MNYAPLIKERVTTPDLFAFYGFQRNSRGFVCCPFHGEKTPSMKVYDGQRGYCCFGGCGARGDIIDFVQRLFGLSFHDAQVKINEDFRLGFPLDGKGDAEQRRRYRREADDRAAKLRAVKAQRERLDSACENAFDAWARMDKQRMQNAPKTRTEPVSEEYAEAVKNLDRLAYELDISEGRRFSFEQTNGR